MMRSRLLAALICGLTFAAALSAQTPAPVGIRVSETAGIRRTGFPVNATVPIPQAGLRSPDAARLILDGKEVPAQYSVQSAWPDGSVARLDVDFNVGIGPSETLDYRLEYGDGITHGPPPRGLAASTGPDAFQSGRVRFSRSGSPLLLSVKYRGEDIGSGLNGLFVTDDTGRSYNLSAATGVTAEVVKSGPLYVVIRYTGNIAIGSAYQVPFVLTAEMPNSKTLVKLTAVIDDPAKRLRQIAIATPLSFAAMPLVWDFGTPRWTYGSLRVPADSVTLTQTAADWQITTDIGGKNQLYEKSGTSAAGPVRWGHIQDGKEVVAFALQGAADDAGTWNVKLEGNGQASFSYTPASPVTQHRISVIEHFVTAPVQIGAATSASSLLSPLAVDVSSR